MTKPRDLSLALAEFAVTTPRAAIPDAAAEKARMSLLDTLGVCLAASGLEPAARNEDRSIAITRELRQRTP